MTRPVRLQLSRRKGFDLQALSRETNGLPAVSVARPSDWGNPYRVGAAHPHWPTGSPDPGMTAEECVDFYRLDLARLLVMAPDNTDPFAPLRGRNLACWCRPGASCHADVLLELANQR